MIQLRRILVPTDFSKQAEYALGYAVFFAQQYGASLTLLHVMAPYFGGTEADVLAVPAAYYGRDLMGILYERLEMIATKIREQGIDVESVVGLGIPFVEIVKTARKTEADLIVIATHGRTGLSHAVLGSTAERVVRKAPCPVLSVRLPDLNP